MIRTHTPHYVGRCVLCGDIDMLDAQGRCSSCVAAGVTDPAEVADEDEDEDDDGEAVAV